MSFLVIWPICLRTRLGKSGCALWIACEATAWGSSVKFSSAPTPRCIPRKAQWTWGAQRRGAFMPWPITSLRRCPLVICSLYHFPSGGSKKSANLPQRSYESLAQFIQAQRDSRGLIRRGTLWIPARSFFPRRSWWRGHCQMKAGLSASISLAPAAAFQWMDWPQLVAPVPLPSARKNPNSSAPRSSSFPSGFQSHQIL